MQYCGKIHNNIDSSPLAWQYDIYFMPSQHSLASDSLTALRWFSLYRRRVVWPRGLILKTTTSIQLYDYTITACFTIILSYAKQAVNDFKQLIFIDF